LTALNYAETAKSSADGEQKNSTKDSDTNSAKGGDRVLVLKNGVTKKVTITTGLKDDVAAEVVKGLQEGDRVVIGTSSPGSSGSSGQSKNSKTNQRTPGMPGLGGPPPMGP